MTNFAQNANIIAQGARHEKVLPVLKKEEAIEQLHSLFCKSSSSCIFGKLEYQLQKKYERELRRKKIPLSDPCFDKFDDIIAPLGVDGEIDISAEYQYECAMSELSYVEQENYAQEERVRLQAEKMAQAVVKEKRRHEVCLAERKDDERNEYIIFDEVRDILAIDDDGYCIFFRTSTHGATFFKLHSDLYGDSLTFELSQLRGNIRMNTTTI